MLDPCAVYPDGLGRDRELAQFGLTAEDLLVPALRALSDRLACAPAHPQTFAGQTQWAATIRYVREQLIPKGWGTQEDKNLPIVISPDAAVAIIAATGDAQTGQRTGPQPKTKNARGPLIQRIIRKNSGQQRLSLFPEDPTWECDEDPVLLNADTQVWVLLFYAGDGTLRLELSLPLDMTDRGRITSWSKRIIITERWEGDTDRDAMLSPRPDAPSEAADPVDVAVRRRTDM